MFCVWFSLQVYIHSNNHAGYYPGAKTVDLKLLFDPKVSSSHTAALLLRLPL
jgi:hypothetical protein